MMTMMVTMLIVAIAQTLSSRLLLVLLLLLYHHQNVKTLTRRFVLVFSKVNFAFRRRTNATDFPEM
tara:strand:+ start:1630 stop:1827 length:198 start_codon:yes stop_codon:yes gene_type:complete